MDYNRSRHCVYMLTYHMVFVTKWRKPAITDRVGDFMVKNAAALCEGYGGKLLSGETDSDHIHLLVSLPPNTNVSDIVRSLKTELSKRVHRDPSCASDVSRYLYGGAPLWSPSYFIATTGSVSMETVKAYIEEQRTEEHHRKYEKRSHYWDGKGKSRPGNQK